MDYDEVACLGERQSSPLRWTTLWRMEALFLGDTWRFFDIGIEFKTFGYGR